MIQKNPRYEWITKNYDLITNEKNSIIKESLLKEGFSAEQSLNLIMNINLGIKIDLKYLVKMVL